jgi:ABC-type antimicrobial peptide transport system ATPase subunit
MTIRALDRVGFTINNGIRALVGRNGTGENYLNKNTLQH